MQAMAVKSRYSPLGADVYGKSALDATQTGRRIDGKEAGDLSSQSPRIYTGSGPVSYRRDKNTTVSATLPETSGSAPTARAWWAAKSSSTGPAMRPRSPPPQCSVRTALMCGLVRHPCGDRGLYHPDTYREHHHGGLCGHHPNSVRAVTKTTGWLTTSFITLRAGPSCSRRTRCRKR